MPESPHHSGTPPVTYGSVLLVEDDPDVSDALEQHLSLNGYHVRTAGNKLEAEALLSAGAPFDAVIVDLLLGNRKAFDLIESLAHGAIPQGPIVITGTRDAGDRADCISRGAHHVLDKPVDTRALLDAVAGEVARVRRNRAIAAKDLANAARGYGATSPERREWFEAVREQAGHWRLTRRETDALVHSLEGLNSTQVAARLCVGRETVRTHVRSIRQKSGKCMEEIRAMLGAPPANAQPPQTD